MIMVFVVPGLRQAQPTKTSAVPKPVEGSGVEGIIWLSDAMIF